MNNYSVRQVKVQFGGRPVDAGRGDGDFVKIEKIEKERFRLKQGVDNTGTRYEVAKNGHKVTLILMQGSKTNDYLTAVHNGDILAGNGAGIGTLQIDDTLGTGLFLDPEGFISDLPDESFSEEPGTLEWVFYCPDPVRNVGSN
jgi:hypothetical protein